ncbi:MAG: aspartate/glutamate racemase family protein [Nocardiopsaceae bacterium]|jgi:Asp/Glu/hydantoin racemase|nr:aspartate/glutamate racemase family protein [Nocardiopsaceae bacterium]
MPRYQTAPGRPAAYGYTIGVLCAEWNIPFVPGDLNNATTFEFPVRYLTVAGARGASVLTGDAPDYAAPFIQAAKTLEAEGVRAITGNCGYMAAYQEAVAASVSVPVFMSSLLQAPLLTAMLGPQQRLAVLVASRDGITAAVLQGAGVRVPDQLVIHGLDAKTHFREVVIAERGVLDTERLRAEVVETAVAAVRADRSVGAILLECSDLPPYARDVHDATGLPVFDWASFIRYVHEATEPRRYSGTY